MAETCSCTVVIYIYIYIASRHSAAEHRASTRIFHLTLFLASVLISVQVLLTPLASSSTVLRHVFFGLPLPRLPWGFHSRACLAMSSDDFRGVWPSHPHLRFLICKSILDRSYSKRNIRNTVVFLITYICTNNLFLLFDNITGMTHLKIRNMSEF